MPTPREVTEKRFYTTAEVAEMLGLNASTLRFWERRFPQLAPRRAPGSNRRLYTQADLTRLRQIAYLLHEKGLRIESALEWMRTNPGGVTREAEVVERLKAIRGILVELRDNLGIPEAHLPAISAGEGVGGEP